MAYYESDDDIDDRVRRRGSLPIPARSRSGDDQPLPEGLQHLHRRVPTFERERDTAATEGSVSLVVMLVTWRQYG